MAKNSQKVASSSETNFFHICSYVQPLFFSFPAGELTFCHCGLASTCSFNSSDPCSPSSTSRTKHNFSLLTFNSFQLCPQLFAYLLLAFLLGLNQSKIVISLFFGHNDFVFRTSGAQAITQANTITRANTITWANNITRDNTITRAP